LDYVGKSIVTPSRQDIVPEILRLVLNILLLDKWEIGRYSTKINKSWHGWRMGL